MYHIVYLQTSNPLPHASSLFYLGTFARMGVLAVDWHCRSTHHDTQQSNGLLVPGTSTLLYIDTRYQGTPSVVTRYNKITLASMIQTSPWPFSLLRFFPAKLPYCVACYTLSMHEYIIYYIQAKIKIGNYISNFFRAFSISPYIYGFYGYLEQNADP